MAEWSDDTVSSSPGDLGAESRLAPKKVAKDKRPRDEAELAGEGPSKRQPARDQADRGKKTKRAPTAPVLQEAPLDIPPLRFTMPSIPQVAG